MSRTAEPLTQAQPARPSEAAGGDTVPALGLERLAEALQTVRRLCPTLPVFGIRWMHFRHPLQPIQEALLREDGWLDWLENYRAKDADRSRWAVNRRHRTVLLQRLMQSIVYAAYLTAQLIRLRVFMRRELAGLTQGRFQLVAKSWCFGPRRVAGDHDFYFGDLQQRLDARGMRMLILCSDVLGGWDWVAFARAHTSRRAPWARLPELALVPPYAPLVCWLQQLLTCARLLRLARRLEDPAARRVCRLASQDCLAPDTAFSALSYWSGREAVRRWHPRAFLMIYEGHAWEACLRLGVKRADPACRTVGYQHTVVFSESLALHRPTSETPERLVPDVVVTLGQVPLDLMREGHEPHRTRLVRFGSFRYHPYAAQEPADPARRTILVAPEGIRSEMEMLFRFVGDCAKRLPTYTFILRCHPETPLEKVLPLLPPGLLELPNVVRSQQRAIEEDFHRASVLLYRGSSTVLYAVLHGLLPIYFQAPATRDRDPLYAMQAWRRHGASAEDVAALLDRHETRPAEERTAEWRAAAEYVHGCTGPVDEQRMEAFLAAVGG